MRIISKLQKPFPSLRIGNLNINPPIIQGGMGVRISKSNLAAAVAEQGCVGVIASVGLGDFEDSPISEFSRINCEALREEIKKAKSMTKGLLGVNIMCALTDFDSLVKTAVEEEIDIIICGAGLPLDLPKYIGDKDIKLIPIVSSTKAFSVICKRWLRNYNKLPDAVIVEGVKAGGHLGFSYEEAENETTKLENLVEEMVNFTKNNYPDIPVIAAGGVFYGSDIKRFIKLGASGVQMGSRFVCTEECDINIAFKQAYINANKEDFTIIKSPVGLPGRVLKSNFVDQINQGKTVPIKCKFHCIKTCNPKTSQFCIADVLTNASKGNFDEGFIFAGSNAYKCDEIVTVKNLIENLIEESIEKPVSKIIPVLIEFLKKEVVPIKNRQLAGKILSISRVIPLSMPT